MRKVRIKTWDQLGKEFGWNTDKSIVLCAEGFTKEMERRMPKDRIIEISDDNTWAGLAITEDMIVTETQERMERIRAYCKRLHTVLIPQGIIPCRDHCCIYDICTAEFWESPENWCTPDIIDVVNIIKKGE